MSNKLGGRRSMAYLGTDAVQPPDMIFSPRDPKTTDTKYSLGDMWLNSDKEHLFSLVSLKGTVLSGGAHATWLQLGVGGPPAGGVTSLSDDAGATTPPDGAGDIKILGDHGINTLSTPANNSITVAIDNAITLGDLTPLAAGVNALTVSTGDIELLGANGVGNIKLPQTTSEDEGILYIGSTRMHVFDGGSISGANQYWGEFSGNISPTNTSSRNIGIGSFTLRAIEGGSSNTNVSIGDSAGSNLSTNSGNNVAVGAEALHSGTSNIRSNIALGLQAMRNVTENANLNIAIGNRALSTNIVANPIRNIVIGNESGSVFFSNERNNILIGNDIGQVGDHTTIRIGAKLGQPEDHTRCFIAGISGVTVANQEMVTIDTVTDQLGSQPIGLLSSSFELIVALLHQYLVLLKC